MALRYNNITICDKMSFKILHLNLKLENDKEGEHNKSKRFNCDTYLVNHLPCNYQLLLPLWHTIRTYRRSNSSSKTGASNTKQLCADMSRVATHHNEKTHNATAITLSRYIWIVWRSIHKWKSQKNLLIETKLKEKGLPAGKIAKNTHWRSVFLFNRHSKYDAV